MIHHRLDGRYNLFAYFSQITTFAKSDTHGRSNPSINSYPKISSQKSQTICGKSIYMPVQRLKRHHINIKMVNIVEDHLWQGEVLVPMFSKVHDTCFEHIFYYMNSPLGVTFGLRMKLYAQIKLSIQLSPCSTPNGQSKLSTSITYNRHRDTMQSKQSI